MDEEEQYRELQFVWHQALDAHSQGLLGLAIRLFEEGIALAEGRCQQDSHQLYQLKRDLGSALADVGDYHGAAMLWQEAGRHDLIGRMLMIQGDMSGAAAALREAIEKHHMPVHTLLARALFVAGDYDGCLDAYLSAMRARLGGAPGYPVAKADCLAALVSLHRSRRELDPPGGSTHLAPDWRRLRAAITGRFGNWHSALAVASSFRDAARLSSLVHKLLPRSTPVLGMRLDYDRQDVNEVLEAARAASKTWGHLQACLEEAAHGRLQRAEDCLLAVCLRKRGLQCRYGRSWYRDLLIAQSRFEEAIELWEEESIGSSSDWTLRFNLLLLMGGELSGGDLVGCYSWLVVPRTSFLSTHRRDFADYCASKLSRFKFEKGTDLMRYVVGKYPDTARGPWWLFAGAASVGQRILKETGFSDRHGKMVYFDRFQEMADAVRGLIEAAELDLRSAMGLPGIGDGWIREAEMVRLLRECVAPAEVVAQASPTWLAGMRFDAFVPSLRLAVEHHGVQHYRSVAHFGGQSALTETKRRDKLKAVLASANGVKLEVIRHDEELEVRVAEIVRRFSAGDPGKQASRTSAGGPHGQ